MHRALAIGTIVMLAATAAQAQCTNYQITVGGGNDDGTIFWQLFQIGGGIAASGTAPITQMIYCLPDGCYYMNMYDDVGDGWGGAAYTIKVVPSLAVVASGTLPDGFGDIEQIELGATGCQPGCSLFQFGVSTGTAPSEISWSFVSNGVTIASGGASEFEFLCLDTGCYVLNMFDSGGDGWNGATWALLNGFNQGVGNGTLASGSSGTHAFAYGVPASQCSGLGPMSPADCQTAVTVCTDYDFQITPNGFGMINEVPALGSVSNPNYIISDGMQSAWSTDNWGCLRINEHNSTWMIVNIASGGSLELTMGGLGTQQGYYDWIMYPYDASACAGVLANTLAPVRCNWNDVYYGGTGLASVTPPGGDPNNYEPPLNVLTGERYVICFSNYSSSTTNVPLVFGGTAVVSCDMVLPVELLGFTARLEDRSVRLKWVTASEQNTSHFEIERSVDAAHWIRIAALPAAGNSAQILNHTSLDADPREGINYYRLRMVDLDGTRKTSEALAVLVQDGGPLVYPNPSDGDVRVRNEGLDVRVLDATGREVTSAALNPGNSPMQLFIGTTGVHVVRIGTGPDAHYERLIVR